MVFVIILIDFPLLVFLLFFKLLIDKNFMLIFWVTGPHTGRIVPNGGIVNKVRIEGDKPTFNPYFYIPKYRSSDALPAPEIFLLSSTGINRVNRKN